MLFSVIFSANSSLVKTSYFQDFGVKFEFLSGVTPFEINLQRRSERLYLWGHPHDFYFSTLCRALLSPWGAHGNLVIWSITDGLPWPFWGRSFFSFFFVSESDSLVILPLSGLQILWGFCPVHLNSFTHFRRLFMLILMVAAKLFAILSGEGRLNSGSWNFMFNADIIWKTTAAIRKTPRERHVKRGF